MLQIQEHLHDRLGELDAEMVIPKRKVRVCIVTGMLLGDIALQQKTSYRRLMGLREPWLACWIICAKQAFHGRMFGGMSATPQEKIQKGFRPLVPGFAFGWAWSRAD